MTGTRLEIGAHLTGSGCFFRVWAPHASEVAVLIQDGDDWDRRAATRDVALARSADGYWSGTVADVLVGHLYRFKITTDGHTFERLDPAARLHGEGQPLHQEPCQHRPHGEGHRPGHGELRRVAVRRTDRLQPERLRDCELLRHGQGLVACA